MIWLWIACRPPDEELAGPGKPLEATFDHLAPLATVGPAPFAAPVRAVGSFGATVPTDAVPVQIDGASATFDDDGTGYGALTLDAPGSFDLLVDGAVIGRLHAVATGVNLGGQTAALPDGPAVAVAPATQGAWIASEASVWWVGAETTLPPHAVLTPGVPILGLASGHVDNDGLIDVVAWGADSVWWLRGRAGGGATWGGGWQVLGASAVDAQVGDVDMDGANDIVILWANTPDGHALDARLGDNAGSFLAARTILLDAKPRALGVGANGTQGEVQVTVLDDTNGWARYVWTNTMLLATGPSLVGLNFEAGTDVIADWDTNGDASDDLVFVGPLAGPFDDVTVEIYDLIQDDGSVSYAPFDVPGGRVALADFADDGTAEMLLEQGDGTLVNSRWNGHAYQQTAGGVIGDPGPITLGDVDGDRTADLVVAGNVGWSVWRGLVGQVGDLATWSAQLPSAGPAVEAVGTIGAMGTQFGKPALVAFAATGTRIEVMTGGESVTYVRTTLDDALTGTAARDVAVCGPIAYALTDTALTRIDLETGAQIEQAWPDGKRVACYEDKVWVLGGGQVAERDGATLDATQGPRASDGRDVAGTADGPITCDVDGCEIVAWTFADDGTTIAVQRDATRVTATYGKDSLTLPPGHLSVGDVDGDGLDDLLVSATDATGTVITLVRATGEGFGPAQTARAGSGGDGPLFVLDAGDDGSPDLHLFAEGTLYRWPK